MHAVFVALCAPASADPRASCEAEVAQLGSGSGGCAALVDVYNRDPAHCGDEVVYQAGVCFAHERSLGTAILMFNMLEKYFPSSPRARQALGLLGTTYAGVAFFDRASDALEAYAKKFAGERDAPDALANAIRYREALGDPARAAADVAQYARTFRDPRAAADAAFSLAQMYERRGEPVAFARELRAYLAAFGASGGDDHAIVAHAELGLQLWAQACPVALLDGACMKLVPPPPPSRGATRSVCGPAAKPRLVAVPRDPAKANAAMAELGAATRAYEQAFARSDEARHAYALAKLAIADLEFERFLAIAFPHQIARFQTYFNAKTKASTVAAEKLEQILAIKDADGAIAAAARLGQLAQAYVDDLYAAEIPADVRTGDHADDQINAYCDALATAGQPLATRAIDAYTICLAKADELQSFGPWSQLCERELAVLAPEQFPPAAELRGVADAARPVTAFEVP